MRAVRLQGSFGIDSLHVVDLPDPRPGPGQVLLRLRAWSLNYRDLLVVRGQYDPGLRLPFVPLSDGVGVVEEVGPGVTRVQPGDRVAGAFMQKWLGGRMDEAAVGSALGGAAPGVLAERVVLHEDGLVHVPEHLTDEEAATLPCAGVTAWHALVAAGGVTAGDVVLTQGSGGVSLFALQLGRLLGARVLATSGSDAKLARLLRLGAAGGINYKTTPEWGKKARELTGGVGVDHVVELGGAANLPESLRAVRLGGRVSLIGVLANTGGFNPLPVLMKHVRLQGIYVGSRQMFEDLNRAVALHGLRPVIDRVFPMAEVRQALRHMEAGAHFGKVVLRAG